MTSRLAAFWSRSPTWRKIATVAGVSFLIVATWIGQGVASVFGQHDAYAEYWEARSEEPGDLLYVALGDSAAQGVGATDPEDGYVGQIVRHVEQATDMTVRIVNLSVTGARTADVLETQLPQLRSVVQESGEPDLITLDVGGNDATNTPAAVFEEQFDELLCELPAGTLVADLPDFQGGPRLEESRRLSAIAREVITEHPDLVPVALEAATRPITMLDYSPDFFHPDDSGYEYWASAYIEQLPEALGGDGAEPASAVFDAEAAEDGES
ncbi:SGNH/GDSL hydrolase family protein [Euzebya tangerina]|uniref:SGNH/GDSL hydrolase family protein n=1 Tax=Euzebya tangerina TaxID=591198 RepID=UPI000E31EE8B|nr:GDSL-type esterase/lipase family protein [Euzebya tangerina]